MFFILLDYYRKTNASIHAYKYRPEYVRREYATVINLSLPHHLDYK